MFRTKKTVKTNRRIREVSNPPRVHSSSEDDLSNDNKVLSEDTMEQTGVLSILEALSSPKVERDLSRVERDLSKRAERDLSRAERETPSSQCRLEKEELRETLHKLGNSLYYLASIIPNEDSWACHFVDTPPHKNNITRAKDKIISIFATLNSATEQFILLPFGDRPMECGFSRQVEFTLTCALGKTTVEAYHVCERGVHKLIFPDEVTISDKEYNLKSILPVNLEH
ncbi:hypothetical protein [Cedratvirus kamchatka]|uniref:Uncharacterized protein n=1 Tax=Cedratvirus kamchatka TaxID=2716914 RepID=A0A6G8MXU1_9VIRU|nr:hypothetical protein [Cedratvirus kamchatka]